MLHTKPWGPQSKSSDDTFLAAAESIGRRIVADAIWHEGV